MSTAFEAAAARVAAGGDHHDEAARIVALMTRAERLGCLDGDTPFWPGLFDMTAGGYYRHPWPAARVERLGVPGIEFADGPRGCVVGDATAFPVSMARGATFDPELEERVGEAIGAELRASGATYTGAVCMNLLRHPAWGRAQETYGEDPHHVGVMAAAFTTGLQRHVMACMKHFALNSMENARFTVDVTVDERALHEVYLPHFERVAAAGVASVMSAYNSVNGEWCGQHAHLLTDILREEWCWDGFVTSDFIFGLRDPATSVRAGLDIEMPFRQQRAVALEAALDRGELAEAHIDRSVERIVATLLRFASVFERRPPPEVLGGDDHRRLAREVAAAARLRWSPRSTGSGSASVRSVSSTTTTTCRSPTERTWSWWSSATPRPTRGSASRLPVPMHSGAASSRRSTIRTSATALPGNHRPYRSGRRPHRVAGRSVRTAPGTRAWTPNEWPPVATGPHCGCRRPTKHSSPLQLPPTTG